MRALLPGAGPRTYATCGGQLAGRRASEAVVELDACRTARARAARRRRSPPRSRRRRSPGRSRGRRRWSSTCPSLPAPRAAGRARLRRPRPHGRGSRTRGEQPVQEGSQRKRLLPVRKPGGILRPDGRAPPRAIEDVPGSRVLVEPHVDAPIPGHVQPLQMTLIRVGKGPDRRRPAPRGAAVHREDPERRRCRAGSDAGVAQRARQVLFEDAARDPQADEAVAETEGVLRRRAPARLLGELEHRCAQPGGLRIDLRAGAGRRQLHRIRSRRRPPRGAASRWWCRPRGRGRARSDPGDPNTLRRRAPPRPGTTSLPRAIRAPRLRGAAPRRSTPGCTASAPRARHRR